MSHTTIVCYVAVLAFIARYTFNVLTWLRYRHLRLIDEMPDFRDALKAMLYSGVGAVVALALV